MKIQESIIVRKATEDDRKKADSEKWFLWIGEPAIFDWFYNEDENLLIIEGKAKVYCEDEKIEIKTGDYVAIKKNTHLRWEIIEKIEKLYILVP